MPSWRITFDGTGQAVGDTLETSLYVPSVDDILPSGWSRTENTGTGGLLKLTNVFASEGSRGIRFECTAATSVYITMLEDATWGTTRWLVADVFIPSAAVFSSNLDIFQPREAATLFRCRINWPSRTVAVVLGSSVSATGSVVLALDTHYRIAFRMVYSATVGVLEAKVYAGNSSTPLETITASGLNTGTLLATNVRFGFPFNVSIGAGGPLIMDNVRGTDGAEPGPSGAVPGTLQNGRLKRWTGSAWVPVLRPKRWSGSAHVLSRPRGYN